MSAATRGTARDSRRDGFLLPLVLLMLLALTAVGMAAFTLALSETRHARHEERYLSALGTVRLAGEPRVGEDQAFLLGGGFVLLRGPPSDESVGDGGIGPRLHRVVWVADPAGIAAGWPAAVTVGEMDRSTIGAVEIASGACALEAAGLAPVIEARSVLPETEPPLGLGPRVGPLALADLVRRLDAELPEPAPEGAEEPEAGGATGDGVRVYGGTEAAVLVLAPGDLRLEEAGEAAVRGLVLVAGDLWVASGVALDGAVWVGGALAMDDGSRISGDRCAIRDALDPLGRTGPHPLPGAPHLGRF